MDDQYFHRIKKWFIYHYYYYIYLQIRQNNFYKKWETRYI